MADVQKPVVPEKKAKEETSKESIKNPQQTKKKDVNEMSEEDKHLSDELDELVRKLREGDQSEYLKALQQMETLIKAATTTMTSVPKPLKFLRKHIPELKAVHDKIIDVPTKQFCADVLSVLSMTIPEGRDCLNYKLLGQVTDNIGGWGHEYVRHLSGEISQDWLADISDERKAHLLTLAEQIIPFNLQHNAEAEACDLALDIEHLELLERFVTPDTHQRVCAYLSSCVPYFSDPDNIRLLKTSLRIYKAHQQWPYALRVAMKLNDVEDIKDILASCPDASVKKQLTFMIARQQIHFEIPDDDNKVHLTEIMTNGFLNQNFMALGRELDILEPKTPEEIYKSHLDGVRPFGGEVESARQNLAASFVSGFVNAGFGKDKLLTEDGNKWLYKNKEHGMLSATASLGLILLWDVDGGLMHIDKYLYSAEEYIKGGALLACGIVNCGVSNECDPAYSLLLDYLLDRSQSMRIGAILGLGLAYTGTNRKDIIESIFNPVNAGTTAELDLIALSALSCGLISVGTCDHDVTTLLLECLLNRSDAELKDSHARFIALGLGLNYLGKQEAAEVVTVALEAVSEPFRSMAKTLVDVCAYAGTGNVLKIQELLHICSKHYEPIVEDEKNKGAKGKDAKGKEKEEEKASTPKDKKDKDQDKDSKDKLDYSLQQSVATLGIALIAVGEDIGTDMAFRSFGHLLRYCEPAIRRAVPLALALLSVSNPRLSVLDTLSKFSHDLDPEVALNSIFSMGIVGAGTNNARVGAMLRQLSQYHAKDSNSLFMVRIAQGLVHLGKGTLGLSPFHSDKQLMSPVAMAGLLSTLFSFLDVRGNILGKGHYMLYCLAAAMNPRMLATFDADLKPLPVTVRVGQAVDTVGLAGKPKSITGFQTYTTPVLLGCGERAELATDDYIALSPILEGFVILEKNPDAS